MTNHPLIVFGSARSEGHTLLAVNSVTQGKPVPLIDLMKLNITYYDYAHRNHEDDFIPLAQKMIEHDPLILATPVYWYTMSAVMKNFLDRWSDLLTFRKDLGRKLAGKELYVITSYATEIPKHFEAPFADTCTYIGMRFKGCFYYYSGEDKEQKNKNQTDAQLFASKIWGKAISEK